MSICVFHHGVSPQSLLGVRLDILSKNLEIRNCGTPWLPGLHYGSADLCCLSSVGTHHDFDWHEVCFTVHKFSEYNSFKYIHSGSRSTNTYCRFTMSKFCFRPWGCSEPNTCFPCPHQTYSLRDITGENERGMCFNNRVLRTQIHQGALYLSTPVSTHNRKEHNLQ